LGSGFELLGSDIEVTATRGALAGAGSELAEARRQVTATRRALLRPAVELTDLPIGSVDRVPAAADGLAAPVLEVLGLVGRLRRPRTRAVELPAEAGHVIAELRDVRIGRVLLLQFPDPVVHVASDRCPSSLEVVLGLLELGSSPVDEVIGPLLEIIGLVGGTVGDIAQLSGPVGDLPGAVGEFLRTVLRLGGGLRQGVRPRLELAAAVRELSGTVIELADALLQLA